MGRLAAYKGIILGLVIATAVAIAAVGGVGWHFSNVLEDGALLVKHEDEEFDLRIVAVDERSVTFEPVELTDEPGRWTKPGIWGLESASAYGRIGEIIAEEGGRLTREFTPQSGTFAAGDRARVDSFAFDGNPAEAHDIDYTNVSYSAELGDYPAWFVPGESDTWTILTHGRTADREEALRILPTITRLGYPALLITYRNDIGTPPSEDGYYRFGATEWRDLEAAVQYALANGATRIVLVGFSMGGGITATFLRNSPLADSVAAVVLDAPVLNFSDLIDYGGERRSIPSAIVGVGKMVAGLRFDIDWSAMDHVAKASEFRAPILLFHGDDDELVHVRSSDAFAEARPDLVTYIRLPDATHVRAWNMDPVSYDGQVETFLLRVSPP